MCQLTIINLKSVELNRIMSYCSALENSRVGNKDGFGIFTPDFGVWKTEKAPSILINYGDIVADIITDGGIVLQHVRAATMNIGSYKREVTPEKAHPFMGEKLVLAHNGVLEFRKREDEKEYVGKEMIDSQVFLAELEKHYTEGDIVKSLQDTMKLFYGKFAFLIYDTTLKTYYVARGTTAKLFKLDIFIDEIPAGYIINTEEESARWAAVRFKNIHDLLYKGRVRYDVPVELEKESVFVLKDDTIEKIGELKEEHKPAAIVERGTNFTHALPAGKTGTQTLSGGKSSSTDDLAKVMSDILKDNQLSIRDLDDISSIVLGKALVELEHSEVERLVKVILPEMVKRNHLKFRKLWYALQEGGGASPYQLIATEKLQFPYFFSDFRKVKGLVNKKGVK